MRLYKLFIASLLAVSTLALQSCLKNQEDIFEESSSQRMQAALDNAKTVLTSSENGWIFDYYPDRDLSYGGFVYTVAFDQTHATVRCELAPELVEKSLYKLSSDNGPVLSFDSYNTLMHFFATPSSGLYEAYDGDFEFMIMDVTEDLITLRGKRTGNKMYLRRLTEDAADYIKAIDHVVEYNIISEFTGSEAAEGISCENDANIRYMEFSYSADENSQTAGEYYLTTPGGIRFKNPVEINGITISELSYNYDSASSTATFSGNDIAGNRLTFTGSLPETFSFFDDYIGDFTFKYYNGTRSINVSIEGDKASGEYTIKGFNPNYDLYATYNKLYGCLELCGQTVAQVGSTNIRLAPWSLGGGGNLYPSSTTYGIIFIKDPQNPGTFLAEPNTEAFATDSFILWMTDLSGTSLGQLPTSNTAWLINGSTQVAYITSLVKK